MLFRSQKPNAPALKINKTAKKTRDFVEKMRETVRPPFPFCSLHEHTFSYTRTNLITRRSTLAYPLHEAQIIFHFFLKGKKKEGTRWMDTWGSTFTQRESVCVAPGRQTLLSFDFPSLFLPFLSPTLLDKQTSAKLLFLTSAYIGIVPYFSFCHPPFPSLSHFTRFHAVIVVVNVPNPHDC